MPSRVKGYISIVIAAACLIMAATAGRANIESIEFWTLAVVASAAVKLRLPGLDASLL